MTWSFSGLHERTRSSAAGSHNEECPGLDICDMRAGWIKTRIDCPAGCWQLGRPRPAGDEIHHVDLPGEVERGTRDIAVGREPHDSAGRFAGSLAPHALLDRNLGAVVLLESRRVGNQC